MLMKNAASQLAFVLKCTGWSLSSWSWSLARSFASFSLGHELPAVNGAGSSNVDLARRFVVAVRGCVHRHVQFQVVAPSRGDAFLALFRTCTSVSLSSCSVDGIVPGRKRQESAEMRKRDERIPRV